MTASTPSTTAPPPLDAIIVGAGLSGLSAATRLVASGKRVLVLEARDRVGGRTLTETLAGGAVDLGGQWIGPTQDRVAALVRELGVRTFAQHVEGRHVLDHRGRLSTFQGLIPRLPIAHLLELELSIRRIDWLARSVDPAAPMRDRRASGWDRIALSTWLGEHVRSDGARAMMELATRAVFAVDSDQISFLYFLSYIRSGGGVRRLAEVRNGAQQDRLVGGAQQLSTRLADRLGASVRLASPVVAIEQSERLVTVRTGAEAFHARRCVLAVPPALAANIAFSPALPVARAELHRRMPMGSVLKVVAAYERPFWRRAGLSGQAIATSGPVTMAFDDCAEGGAHPALVAFVLGRSARELSAMPGAERRGIVLGALARWFGPEAQSPAAYAEKDWIADPWSTGCYVGVMPPGALAATSAALRAPVGRVHVAGTESATRWTGYLDGAIEAGHRAADEIRAALD